MSDQPAWGTPSRDPSDRGPSPRSADARTVEDDRIDELYETVVDTGRRPSRSAGTAPSGRGRLAVGLVAGLVVCAVVGWLFLRTGSTGSASGTSETDWATQSDVWAADSTPGLIDDLVEVAGGTQFVSIDLYADSVSAVAPTAPGATTADRYSWHDGQAERGDPEGLADPDELFDVTTVDWTAVGRFVARAPELSGLDDRPWVVQVRRAVDGGASAAAKLSLSVNDDHGRRAHLVADEQGQIVWMEGDVEGSPAFDWEATGLFQTDRTQRAIADLVAAAGSTQFLAVDLYSYSVSADALDAAGSRAEVYWSKGFASSKSATGKVDPAKLFDITTVDWTLLKRLVGQARDLTGLDDQDPRVSVHGPMWTGEAPVVVFDVYLSDHDSVYGKVVFDLAGQVVSMHGGAPGSASYEANP